MATHVVQVVARLPHEDGLPEDTVENTFNIGWNSAPTAGNITPVLTEITQFYNSIPSGVADPPSYFISELIDRGTNACQLLAYVTDDLSGGTPMGSPVTSANFTLGAAEAALGVLPEEVSAVISYHGDLTDVPVSEANPSPPPATIRPQQRRRGRLFFGPLGQIAGVTTSTSYRPSTTFRLTIASAYAELAQGITANSNGDLGVWSRSDAAVYNVTAGWVDDAWDTQRRRGVPPTTRTPFFV